ncbi:unnamed protein product [Clavelina lepadiformis]|uniref:C2HC/C3H-type domain-containing protein n=1 Tax=Clavelina lepadiformis TaxID=159417 RepID=A0ABP0GPR2_CLALP
MALDTAFRHQNNVKKSTMENPTKTHFSRQRHSSQTKHSDDDSKHMSLLYVMQRNYREKLAMKLRGEKGNQMAEKGKTKSLVQISEKSRQLVNDYNTSHRNGYGPTKRETTWSGSSNRNHRLPPLSLRNNTHNSNVNDSHMMHAHNEYNYIEEEHRQIAPNLYQQHKHNLSVKNISSLKAVDKQTANGLSYQAKKENVAVPPMDSILDQTLDGADSPPPNLSNLRLLKSKKKRELLKLKNKQTSSFHHCSTQEDTDAEPVKFKSGQNLSDFQKWQLEQDSERENRLQKYQNKKVFGSEFENVSFTEIDCKPFAHKSSIYTQAEPKTERKHGLFHLKSSKKQEKAIQPHKISKTSKTDGLSRKVNFPSSRKQNKQDSDYNENSVPFDKTYSKQSGMSDEIRSYKNKSRMRTLSSDSSLALPRFQKPVLVRHDGCSSTSSRASTRNTDYSQGNQVGRDIKATGVVVEPRQTLSKHQNNARETITNNVSNSTYQLTSSAMEIPEYGVVNLIPCDICGRQFNEERLEKHKAICSKTSSKKRKVFNMPQARKKGTDMESYSATKFGLRQRNRKEVMPKSNWRVKHEDFIKTIRQAKAVSAFVVGGGNIADLPPPTPSINPDYVHCQYCDRRFAPKVAERHIPRCKDIKSRPPPPKKKISLRK